MKRILNVLYVRLEEALELSPLHFHLALEDDLTVSAVDRCRCAADLALELIRVDLHAGRSSRP